jgi:hypothetical protein
MKETVGEAILPYMQNIFNYTESERAVTKDAVFEHNL